MDETMGTTSVTVMVEICCSVTVTVTILPPWFAFAELVAAGDAAGDAAAGDAAALDVAAAGACVGTCVGICVGAGTFAGTGAEFGSSAVTCGSADGFIRIGVAILDETPADKALVPDTWAAMKLPAGATGCEVRVMSMQEV
jgi:hypothetical protein